MATEAWYYLHENGELICKPNADDATVADIRESTFARGLWPADPKDREGAWILLVEALAGGAKLARIKELAAKWGCDDKDAEMYASRIPVLLSRDGNSFVATREDFVNLVESDAGYGDTALEAMADLCKRLGYEPSKMWGTTFAMLATK